LLLKKGEGSGKRTYEYAKGRGRMFTRIERYCGAPETRWVISTAACGRMEVGPCYYGLCDRVAED